MATIYEQERVIHEGAFAIEDGDFSKTHRFAVSDLDHPEDLATIEAFAEMGYRIVLRQNTTAETWDQFRQHPSPDTFFAFAKRTRTSVEEAINAPELTSRVAAFATNLLH